MNSKSLLISSLAITSLETVSSFQLLPLNKYCSTFNVKLSQPRFSTSSELHSLLPNDRFNEDNFSDEDDEDDLDDFTKEDFPLDMLPETLGINLGSELKLDKEEIKREGTKIIDEAFDSQIKEIETLRKKMKRDIDKNRSIMNVASELKAQYETEKLLERIDAKSAKFMDQFKDLRDSTKLAYKADRNMEGKGIELGSWGRDDFGNAVNTGFRPSELNPTALSSSSIDQEIQEEEWGEVLYTSQPQQQQPKVLFIADETKEDASKLLPLITKNLQEKLSIQTQTISSIRPVPMGGNDAQTVVFFCSGFQDRSTVSSMIDRCLSRAVVGDGRVSIPPSHFVCVGDLGTDAMQVPGLFNVFGGNKVEKKREMEEALVSQCRVRGFDYSIMKIGNIKNNAQKLEIKYGDSLKGDVELETASQVLLQTIAFQSSSVRNVTFSVIGKVAEPSTTQKDDELSSIRTQLMYDELFLKLQGPELFYREVPKMQDDEGYERLIIYLQQWANTVFVKDKSGLSTPVTIEPAQNGVKILFKQTQTGKSYRSKDEEREVEQQSSSSTSGYRRPNSSPPPPSKKEVKEGGIYAVVERKLKNYVNEEEDYYYRVRAMRCNMEFDTVVKEMSEEVILKKLDEAVTFFVKGL